MATPVAKLVGALMTTWRVRTLHADGSQTIVAVDSYRRALALIENARPGDTVTIDDVRGSHTGA